jgi:two-component system, NtrC family, sensor kinase
MRMVFSILLLVLFHSPVWSQNTSIIHLNQIPVDGILLDKGWKFQTGDNVDWSKPQYDDKAWKTATPTSDVYDLPQLKAAGIGWFRLKLSVDSTLLKQALVILIEQTGASELFLNGKRLYVFGSVSSNQNKVKTYNPLNQPLSLLFDTAPIQVLAVRFAYKKNVPYFKYAETLQ